MKKFLLLLALAIPSGVVHAELTQFTANKVQRAHNLQQEDKLPEAIELLAGLNPAKAYDKAFVKRMLGVFYWQQGSIKPAIDNLADAVDSGLLKDEQAWTTQRMLADILLTDAQYKRALPHYYQLTKNIPEQQQPESLWLRIAQSHYQLGEWQPVLKAVQVYQRYVKQPDVPILSMKLGAQLQLERWKSALPTLQSLIALEPDHLAWWQQMAGLQLRLGRTKNALETLALAKRQGVALTQQNLTTLAQLYAQQGIPERAAIIYSQLDGANNDAELMSMQAMYWQQAKEWDHAISAWKIAAKLDDRHRWALAQLLLQEGQFDQALAQLDKVKQKASKAEVELARVQAYYKMKDYEKAIIHAKQANNIQSSATSKSWIKYLNQMREMDG
ncbi:tetratricopeptide repeat protein [Photobacterium atrarenae]